MIGHRRTEFGLPRTTCDCDVCKTNCLHMPGMLIPADLNRMIPAGVDPLVWAETNLLASPGALVSIAGGRPFRIHTLVPAVKPDGSCIHLSHEGLCQIHESAPFGCAFFDCAPERNDISKEGLMAIARATHERGPYRQIWLHLAAKGLVQQPPEVLRRRMGESV